MFITQMDMDKII